MKILLITGSPRKKGTSSLLADRFVEGATKAGHEVYRFDAAFKNIHACVACRHCRNTDDGCVFKDDMWEIYSRLLEADAVVFAAPIYYYDWSAQLKLVIDRFYAHSPALRHYKKTALMLTMEDETMKSANGAILSYEGMTDFLKWERVGIISALNCLGREDIEKTDYPQMAYALGEHIGR